MMKNHTSVRSSWNEDRFAASCSKQAKARAARKPYLYASYRDNTVSVHGARGKVHFTLSFDEKVVSALVVDDRLVVTTADDVVMRYDAVTGEFIPENPTNRPAGVASFTDFAFAA